jgi:hypothetical protein
MEKSHSGNAHVNATLVTTWLEYDGDGVTGGDHREGGNVATHVPDLSKFITMFSVLISFSFNQTNQLCINTFACLKINQY